MQKLEARKAALERTAALTDDKKAKWREVVIFPFMSSEESGKEEVGDDTRPVLYTKALPWSLLMSPGFLTNWTTK